MNLEVYISQIVEVVTLMLGWYYFQKLSKPYKIIVIYVSFSVITVQIGRMFSSILGTNYLFYHLYTPMEFIIVLLGILYFLNIRKTITIVFTTTISYLLIWIYLKFTIEPFNQIDNISVAIANSIIFIFAVYGSLKIALSSFGSIFHDSRIIMLSGILVYFGGSIIIFALSNLIFLEGEIQAKYLWKIHNVLHIMFNLLIMYSFYLFNQKNRIINVE